MGDVLTFPTRAARVSLTPELRASLEGVAQAALDVADRIISTLDLYDGDPDGEDGGDDEPSPGTPDGHASQIGWARGGDRDLEAALGQIGRACGARPEGEAR